MYNPTDLAALRRRDLLDEAAASRDQRLARLAKACRAQARRATRRTFAQRVVV